jgi:hypothetical protein
LLDGVGVIHGDVGVARGQRGHGLGVDEGLVQLLAQLFDLSCVHELGFPVQVARHMPRSGHHGLALGNTAIQSEFGGRR